MFRIPLRDVLLRPGVCLAQHWGGEGVDTLLQHLGSYWPSRGFCSYKTRGCCSLRSTGSSKLGEMQLRLVQLRRNAFLGPC